MKPEARHPTRPSFASAEVAGKTRVTRRERFLSEMDAVAAWARLVAVVEPL
jgi:IS5 family transposase